MKFTSLCSAFFDTYAWFSVKIEFTIRDTEVARGHFSAFVKKTKFTPILYNTILLLLFLYSW